MAETTLQLGFVPKNRGEYQSTPVTRYYKDNVVQYNGSSYIADPIGWSEDHPTDTYVTIAPTDISGNLNAGWKVFASGNNAFTTGEKVDSIGIDNEPTANSDNLVKSGGVQNELALGAVYDVSAKNPTAGPNNDGKWESLTALFTDANINTLIPTAVRKGGMSVKFVQSSDNKYVQYRYKLKYENTTAGNNAFTIPNNWQGVDKKPVIGSTNLVESGDIAANHQVYDSVIESFQRVNLFNKNSAISGYYVRRDNGRLQKNVDYFTTDYIPIDSNGVYAYLAKTGGTYFGYACYSEESEDSYTHGDSSNGATWQSGDKYVRFSGYLTQINTFMAVAGTASDYPSSYVPYGFYGKLRENTVGTEQLESYSVGTEQLGNKSVTADKMGNTNIYKVTTDYEGTIKELYFINRIIATVDDISVRYYGNTLYVRGKKNSNVIWTTSPQITDWLNGKVYALTCTTGGGGVEVSDIVGYIVFSDIDSFKVEYGIDDVYVNLYRASHFIENQNIEDYLLLESKITNERLGNKSVGTDNVKDEAITIDKVSFATTVVLSNNHLDTNDPDFSNTHGDYINRNTGMPAHTPSESTTTYGRTGFIPVSADGLYCNAYLYAGEAIGGAVYDSNKVWKRALTAGTYTYEAGDAYVRWSLKQNPNSPYSEGQLMVWEGSASLNPVYDVYSAKRIINNDVLPEIGNYSELNEDIKERIIGDGVEICMPDTIPCVIGDTLRIYFRSVVKAPNPYIWDIGVVGAVGKSYPRYYEYTPPSRGNRSVTLFVRNAAQRIVAQKTFIIKCINPISSPVTNKNILMLGASMTEDGTITHELNRRLTGSDGSGTTYNPTGLGLSNISFVGRLTGSTYPVHQEAQGGWSWKDYATIGRQAYRFYISDVNELKLDDVYRDANSNYEFTIKEINVTEGTGNIRCTFTGSGTLANSGTLTIKTGTGDSTITYSSCQLESGNPFWNVSEDRLDLNTYVNEYCDGSLDYIVSYVGYNDFSRNGANPVESIGMMIDYIRTFAQTFHTQLPNAKLIQCTLALGSVNGGMAESYGASSSWNYYNTAVKVWTLYDALKVLEAELEAEATANEEAKYFYVFDTFTGFDCENLYPTGNKPVTNRSTATEVIQTNGIHSTTAGKLTIADSIYEALNNLGL